MTYQMELLVEQRVAELRKLGAKSAPAAPSPVTRRRPAREALGRGLVRLGYRLAQPAGAAAVR
jgi:hypothetical protein